MQSDFCLFYAPCILESEREHQSEQSNLRITAVNNKTLLFVTVINIKVEKMVFYFLFFFEQKNIESSN